MHPKLELTAQLVDRLFRVEVGNAFVIPYETNTLKGGEMNAHEMYGDDAGGEDISRAEGIYFHRLDEDTFRIEMNQTVRLRKPKMPGTA